MLWIVFFAVLIAVAVNAYSVYGLRGALYAGAASALAFWAGAGLRGSVYGDTSQLVGGAIAALGCVALALWLSQGLMLRAFGYEIVGWHWAAGVFVGCFLFTSKRFAPRML